MSAKRLFSLQEFIEIYSKVPRLATDLIIKKGQGIVLAKRGIEPYKGMWHCPGGTILFDESLEQAIKRIAKDELNLQVSSTKFLEIVEYLNEPDERFLQKHRHTVCPVFLVHATGELRKDDDASEVGVFDRIPENIIPQHKTFLEKYKKEWLNS